MFERRLCGLLLAASLWGCSLSAPSKDELFSPSTSSDAGPRDGASDATVDELDSGRDAATGDASVSDAADVEDAAQDAAAFDPQAGLKVHYRFNEMTGNTVNDFAGDKDAVIQGTPSGFEQWVAGHSDNALKLAGVMPDGGTGHYVAMPQGILLGLNECTISLWLNRTGGPMWQRVFDLGSGPPVWLYFTALGGTGLPIVAGRTPSLIFVDYVAIPDAPTGEGQLRINQSIPVGTWTHFVLTWSGTQLTVYLNGKQVAQTVTHAAVTPTDLGNTSQNYLGRSQFVADPYFDGMIDEFRIYDHVLSASDVSALYELN